MIKANADVEAGDDVAVRAKERVDFEAVMGSFSLGVVGIGGAVGVANLKSNTRAYIAGKVRAGTDFLITQLFFDNQDYFDFVERAREAGITVPIVPGIMPVISAANIRRITALCGARIPPELDAGLAETGENDARTLELGIEWATLQCRELLERGAPGIHFYTLNRSPATRRIYQNLF